MINKTQYNKIQELIALGYTNKYISKELSLSEGTVIKWKCKKFPDIIKRNCNRKYKSKQTNTIVNEELIKKISIDYVSNKHTKKNICITYNITRDVLNTVIKDFNLYKGRGVHKKDLKEARKEKAKYNLTDTFFEKINTQEGAYILGFLYADGYINKDTGAVSLTLQKRDLNILIKIREILGSTHPIKIFTSRQREYARYYICCKYMAECLSSLGCYKNKSRTLTFPEFLVGDLLRHFIRGYFDGDGCFYISKRKQCFGFVGNVSFIEDLQKYLTKTLRFTEVQLGTDSRTLWLRTYGKSGRNNVVSFRDWLYKDATIFLQRKFDKVSNIDK